MTTETTQPAKLTESEKNIIRHQMEELRELGRTYPDLYEENAKERERLRAILNAS